MAGERLWIVGDVHGHLGELKQHLQQARVIDERGAWIGGTSCLAVLGDLMDRGPDGAGVVEFLRQLQVQAGQLGGKVIVLLGNHEVLFVGAKWFGATPTESRGGSFLADWLRLGGQEADMNGLSDAQVEWMADLPAMAVEREQLLIHADSMLYAEYGSTVEEVNSGISHVMRTEDPNSLLGFLRAFSARAAFQGPDGPANVERMLTTFQAQRIVHGHTPIARVAEQPPETVDGPYIYAEGRCVNVDPGLYLGGPGFVFEAL